MALVRDPLTGQMIDDGQPSGVLDTAAAQSARASAVADAQRQQAARQRGAAAINNTVASVKNALIDRPALALSMLPQVTFTSGLPDWRSPSEQALAAQRATQYSPLAQAGAVRAYDMAQNAVRAGLAGINASMRADPLVAPATPVRPSLPTMTPAAQPAQPTVGGGWISAGDQAVLAQDRANLQNAVNTLNSNFDTWRVPQPSAPAVQTAAGGGAGGLSADQQPQRGNYTQYNTNLDALRQRALPSAGIDLGASALAAQPAAPAQPEGINVHGLSRSAEDMATSNNPFERRAGLARMQIEGQQAVQAANAQAALAQAQMAGQFGLQEANLRGQYGLQGADVQGQYGLQERALANQGQLEAAKQTGLASLEVEKERGAAATRVAQIRASGSAGTENLRQQQALAEQIRVSQMLDALSRNDMDTYQQLQFGAFAPQPKQPTDVMTGNYMTPEEQALRSRISLAQLRKQAANLPQ